MQVFQTTLERSVQLEGVGVHGGRKATLKLYPAPANHGIVFTRHDANKHLNRFPALSAYSVPADLCTVLVPEKAGQRRPNLAADESLRVETIEHLMSALYACGIDNVRAEVSDKELPILDGSAAFYVKAFAEVGLELQRAKRKYLEILKPVRVEADKGNGFAEFLPLTDEQKLGQYYDIDIDFDVEAIGRQHLAFALERSYYIKNLAQARTFGFLEDAKKLRARGLVRGASEQNSVVIDDRGRVLNPKALRTSDGFVRHKALDAVGDTALLGNPFLGTFSSFKGGHKLNGAAVAALLADKSNYQIIELEPKA